MRPMYETPEQREAERRVGQRVAQEWGCDFYQNKKAFCADFTLIKGDHVAFAECKIRKHMFGHYPDLYLSALKVQNCISLSMVFQKPMLLVVGFNDGIYYTNLNKLPLWDYRISINGNGKRDGYDIDPQDREPLVHIPNEAFQLVVSR